ncbi:MAG: sugar phosphate isomerase, partial [Actinobacteria bacterium RBG_19FT_COMBO_36_27]
MYSSFPTWIPAYPIEYVITRLAKIGYDGIELGAAAPVAYPPYITKEDRKRISNLLKDNNIEISSVLICPGGANGNNIASPIEAERKQTIQSYKDCIDLSHDLGGKLCGYVAGWVIWGVEQDQAWEWSREGLIEIAKYAEAKGITISVEPTPTDSNLIETADDALKLMRETDMSNVKVMFDCMHVFYRGDMITDYIEKMGSDLAYIHVTDLHRMPPGTSTDFTLMIDALKAI